MASEEKLEIWKDVIGVFWHKSTGKWRVRFRVNGKDRHFGLYLSEEEAMRKYKELFNNYKSLK